MKGTSHCSIHSTQSDLLNNFIFADFLLIEGYQQSALRKQPVIAPFKERFKTISLRNCNW